MIQALHTTWCQVSDMDRAVHFYRDVLGLTPGHLSPYWSDFNLSNGSIGLHPRLKGATDPLGAFLKGWNLGMKCDDIRALKSKIEAEGATLYEDYHEIPGGVVITVGDPDGNPIQIMQEGIRLKDLAD